jgi:hypothetical protein
MKKKIAFLTCGNGSQIRSFQDFAAQLDAMLYLEELESHDLQQYAAIVVPDAMNGERLGRHAAALNAYVRSGGFLIVFDARKAARWLDVVELTIKPSDTRDWKWWTKPGGRLEIHQPEPKHPICSAIPEKDMGWHWFGAFAFADGAHSALNLDDDSASLFLDFPKLEGGGRLIVSTLDPHLHNGERFMPATTRFLRGFYPWLNRELGIERHQSRTTVTYVQCSDWPGEKRPPELEASLLGTEFRLNYCPLYELGEAALDGTDILYLPSNHDQFFLRSIEDQLLQFLASGGHMVICSEPAIEWLPFLKRFEAVPPRPFSNIKVRVRNDPYGFFANMAADFDGWQDIFGQYARGSSPMPEGAIWLTDVGPQDNPKPADWLWQYPTDDGKGGYVFMHNGDNMFRYPDHGPGKELLVRDICRGLTRAAASSGLPGRGPRTHPVR